MKKVYVLLFVLSLSILLVGCNSSNANNSKAKETPSADDVKTLSEKSFVVEKRQGEEEYQVIKEVVKSDEIETAMKIIDNAKWEENTEVSMPLPPEYSFILDSIKYGIWVTPNGDRLEIVAEGQAKYVKLPLKESETLHEIITRKEF